MEVRPGGWNKIYWQKYAFVDKLHPKQELLKRKTPLSYRLGAPCANVAFLPTATSGQIPLPQPRSIFLGLFTHAEVKCHSQNFFLPK